MPRKKVVKPPRTHCRNGHELNQRNSYENVRGFKSCLVCANDVRRRYRNKKKLAILGRRVLEMRSNILYELISAGALRTDGMGDLELNGMHQRLDDTIRSQLQEWSNVKWGMIQ